ncbi:MAG: HlyD family efflux transporter periplasmic adaptor subunit [Bacteroidetes bacterium]|nr:HlyD family efflux transporter periplasmic adaptor subunit [Bacteroidota bacterium]
MNNKYIMLVTLAFAAVACNNNNDKSDAYGNFEATEVIVSSQANGKLLSLNITEGQVLKAGEIYGFVDTTDLFLKKQQLQAQKEAVSSKISNITAQIDVLKQQKQNLEIDKDRIVKMNKDGAATIKQLDDVIGAIDVINKQINSIQTQNNSVFNEITGIEKQVEQISTSIQKSYIRDETAGTVLVKYAEQGEITAFGKPLYKMANLNEMILKVYVSGDQLPKIKIGSKCEVMVDLNQTENKKYEGIISWVADNAEFTPKIIQTKKERINLVYAVKVLVKNDGSLKIGMPGEVNF